MPMNINDAAYNTAHDYPGGCDSLAPRMGINSGAVLRNKVNPNMDTHHLRLDEAVKMMEFTGDTRIAQAIAFQLGGVFVKLPDCDVEDERCIETLTDLFMCAMSAQGQTCAELQVRKADGELCSEDRKVLTEKAQGVIEAMQRFIALIK